MDNNKEIISPEKVGLKREIGLAAAKKRRYNHDRVITPKITSSYFH